MIADLKLETFLSQNKISPEDWDKSQCDWSSLLEIAIDHEDQMDQLRQWAQSYAGVIQRFEGVHSVRVRVKEPEHLIEKIVRKKLKEPSGKYSSVTRDNYYTTVTDLIGIRALHLFKSDGLSILGQLSRTWTNKADEHPIAYVRKGDPPELTKSFEDAGLSIEEHPYGYRSIHLVFASQPMKRVLYAEVQIRTIFEEGWSEIDHKIRYPNFSDEQQVHYILTILNRLAGTSDEMAGFVRGLDSALREKRDQIKAASEERDSALKKIEGLLKELEGASKERENDAALVQSLRSELERLKPSFPSFPSLSTSGMPGSLVELVSSLNTSSSLVREAFQNLTVGGTFLDQINRSNTFKLPQ